MAFCGRCGSRVEPGTAYCVDCGRPVGGGAGLAGADDGGAYEAPPERPPERHRGLVVGVVAVALVLVAGGGFVLVRTGADTGPGDTRAVAEDRRADDGPRDGGPRDGDGDDPRGGTHDTGEGSGDGAGPDASAAPSPDPTVTVTADPPPAAPAPPPVTVTAVPVPQGERPYPGSPMSTRIRRTWSPDVEWVQATLVGLGYSWVVVDGHYGPQTAGAVRDFQRAQGLYVDGVVGPQTWTSLAALR